ncbi:MFS transporter [Planktothrix sp. FACHB-1355]|uniref:MFS transporter n=1 Tax=Aerosakkonema funiforme FACHB-1375 TaxID=2949571 RepID=A0A926VCE0_9CYAN|nr:MULTISPECIES: MFS transporter [Oscillatoriales]MBD2181247.1 MFS transporter [Aerosakkonema funiforme FACHB-1375]MBD3557875.1 MFS transporter [Planktothrix sp. FACHB-1355]
MKIDKNRFGQILRALKSRNFRLFFLGQGISLIGTWITQVATIWVVYQLTNSALLLGVTGFASQIPNFILAPFGGIFGDRWNRHRLLVITQILLMMQSLTLAFLALTGKIQIWHMIVLSISQGTINAFEMPIRQAFVVEMVENREDLGNAIALNSSLFNSARLLGPGIAGLLIAAVGAGVCFLIDGLSFIAVIASLLAMNIKPREIAFINPNHWERLKEGFVYSFNFPPIRAILMLLALVSFMGTSYMVLVPVFATKILHGSADTLGFLMAASGVGAFVAAIYLSARQSIAGIDKLIVLSSLIWGIGLIAFGISRTPWVSLLMMFVIGFGSVLLFTSCNTLLQTIVDDDKRGRVMSLYIMAFSTIPLGNLCAGTLAEKIGASYTLVISGIFCILGALVFVKQLPSLKEFIHPLYAKIGILR